MVVAQLPAHIQALAEAFVAELDATLGEKFVGMFQYGAVLFPPSPVSDFDANVIVSEPFTDEDKKHVKAMQERLLAVPLGDDMDVWYITLDAAKSREYPITQARDDGLADKSWALLRAHIHAGRYVVARGPDPREFVPVPTWDELDDALQGEFEWLAERLDEAPAYCVLNLCRILYSYETRDVVTSKLQSAVWALAFVDVDDHVLIRTALNAYDTKQYAIEEDVNPFFERMRGRIARARELG